MLILAKLVFLNFLSAIYVIKTRALYLNIFKSNILKKSCTRVSVTYRRQQMQRVVKYSSRSNFIKLSLSIYATYVIYNTNIRTQTLTKGTSFSKILTQLEFLYITLREDHFFVVSDRGTT